MTTPAYDHDRLRLASEPAYAVLDELIHRGAPDLATRTIMTTALVLTLWQRCGRRMTHHIPSMISLNVAGAATDPIDDFVKSLIWNEKRSQPGPHGRGVTGSPIKPADAHKTILVSLLEMQRLNKTIAHNRFAQEGAQIVEKNFREARMSAFGYGTARAYTRAWDDQLGLLADDNNEVILRLNSPKDRDAFRRDAMDDPGKLLLPSGVGVPGLFGMSIGASVSGSLNEALWDENLIKAIISMGLPIIFLPHTAADPLNFRNIPALQCLESSLANGQDNWVNTSLSVTPTACHEAYVKDIRRRLHLMSDPGTYEFAILQVLHQLRDVCYAIARYACKCQNLKGDQLLALWFDLNAYTLRGIATGIAAFAWHGLGFDPGCTRQKAVKIIKQLREKGEMTPSEIQRSAHLKKEERDLMLKRLCAEDLIRVEGQTVKATTFAEFVTAIHARPTLPEPMKFKEFVAGVKRRHARAK